MYYLVSVTDHRQIGIVCYDDYLPMSLCLFDCRHECVIYSLVIEILFGLIND